MFDAWMGNTELTAAALIVSVAVFLPLQLLLCFKVRSRVIRLLPVIVLAIPAFVFYCSAIMSTEWNGFGDALLAIVTSFMLAMCGLGWGIWAIAKLVQKRSR